MKTALLSLVVILSFTPVFSQGLGDPFNWTEPIKVEANDIFLQWLEDDGTTVHSYQKIYKYKIDSTWLPVNERISKTIRHEDNRTGAAAFTDAATGKFNNDLYDDVVSIWHSGEDFGDPGIEIMLPEFDTTNGMWTNSVQATLNVPVYHRIYVRTGDFDADGFDEFVISNISGDDSIHFYIYDVDSTLQPTLLTSFSDEKLGYDFDIGAINYFIESGDFNGDGKDEILLQGINGNTTSSNWGVYVKIYELNGNIIEPKARRTIQTRPGGVNTDLFGYNIAISKGNFLNDDKDEIAFLTIINESSITFTGIRSYLYLLEASSDLQEINFDPAKRKIIDIGNAGAPAFITLSIASGDLNNDGRDEIVFVNKDHYYTYSTDDDLNLFRKGTGNITESFYLILSYNHLKITDVNQDGREDIIIVINYNGGNLNGIFVAMITVNNELDQFTLLGRLIGDEADDMSRPFAIAAGNFDGLDFTIGQPMRYSINDIVQPIVLLNAPPVHFDMFDGDVFDVNDCYNGGACDFFSVYKKVNTSSIEVSTKVHKDWAISSGNGISGSIPGASINYEAHFTEKYGRNFSKDSTNITTITVGVEVQAKEDDQIYTTVTDYDLWEYPLYHGDETTPRKTILTLVPLNVEGRWFPSKSYNAVSYIPDHEVSNILSYRAYDTLSNNPYVSQYIGGTSFVLGPSGNHSWNVTMATFASSQADTVMEQGLDIGLNFGIIFDLDYSEKIATTHKTSITKQVDLQVNLGSVNLGLGDTKYSVSPYAYWDKKGSLVVDFAAKPELAPPGFPLTWWQQRYGNNSDPTFILPWRLDPEKGFSISEEAKRFQTKDIIFTPVKPNPGDTLTITARVRNFSIIPTPLPVSVKFYIGDPDSAGTPIIGLNGTNTVNTIGPVLERGRADVEFKCILPPGTPSFPRIYAVLDQDNAITEIHETNNKGFNVLGAPSIPTNALTENDIIPTEYILYQSYPNPFNPSAAIRYSIPRNELVNIKVYDMLGSEVITLINEYQTAGIHSVNFNGSKLASGIYFYQIHAGSFIETKKMILMK